MAYTAIDKPSDYFDIKLYTGNNRIAQTITGLDFQPDFTWIKCRTAGENHALTDAVRGVNSQLVTNNTNAQTTLTTIITAFTSDGYSLGVADTVNNNGGTYVSWNWKANGAGATNEAGSINTIKTSVSTTSGFSISQWVGTGSNATIGHGLGVTPKCFIVKKTSGVSAWSVYHEDVGNTKFLNLNGTGAATTGPTVWNNTSPTSSVFSVGTGDNGNASGATYIGYFFAEKQGYSKFGSYTGNGNANAPFIYTGFKPNFIMLKNASTAQDWQMYTWDMQPYNEFCTTSAGRLKANTADAQSTKTAFDMLSNGFKMRTDAEDINASGNEIIYMAFAEEPLITSTGIPTPAR